MVTIYGVDKKFNEVTNEFYNMISDEDISDIAYFFQDSENVDNDLMNFYIHCDNENAKVDKSLYKMLFENIAYSLVGLRNKSFEKTIDNDIQSRKLENNRSDFYSHWVPTFSQVKPMIVNIYKKYYEIVMTNGGTEDLKEMKALYQAICYYLFKLLPQDYQDKLLQKEEFEILNNIKTNFSRPNEFFISKIDYKIREHILKKYNVDLFESFYKDQKESYSKNINKF